MWSKIQLTVTAFAMHFFLLDGTPMEHGTAEEDTPRAPNAKLYGRKQCTTEYAPGTAQGIHRVLAGLLPRKQNHGQRWESWSLNPPNPEKTDEHKLTWTGDHMHVLALAVLP